MAFEMRDLMKQGEQINLVSNADYFQFVPSNPWVADWRTRDDIWIDLGKVISAKGIDFTSVGGRRGPRIRKVC